MAGNSISQSVDSSRRRFIKNTATLSLLAALESLAPAYAWQKYGTTVADKTTDGKDNIFDLTIERKKMTIAGREANPITLNGSIPGPLIRLKQGRNAVLNVTNNLTEDTSIHWHGILLPYQMDGVPGVSFPGIKPGETFTYRFPVKQYGTYWYHSHSGLQEQLGHYAPLVVDPAGHDPIDYDREFTVVLSDWTFHDPNMVMAKLKKAEGYYNYQKRTVADFFKDVEQMGWGAAWQKASMWGQMRMSSRDLLDITGAEYTYLMNGLASQSNWTGLFKTGEKVRLRFINAAAMTFFDVRIPGLKMTVVQADGQNIQPVTVDEFRIGNAETYDVIVEPKADQAYTVFAEAMDRSGYVRGTLAPREGMEAEVPALRSMPERGMESMGMGHDMDHGMSGMNHSSHSDMPANKTKGMSHENHDMSSQSMPDSAMQHDMQGMSSQTMADHSMGHENMDMQSSMSGNPMNHDNHSMSSPSMAHDSDAMSNMAQMTMHSDDHHGPGAAMVAMQPMDRMDDPGVGLENTPQHRVLVYRDLKAIHPWPDQRPADREIELHLTGNMERYMWSFDGKKFSEVDGPILFHYGERLRLSLVNDTMMDHPIHLHGMWMEMENGHGDLRPRKHTIVVKPGEKISSLISVDAKGDWAFHCHLMYHMKAGMFRVVRVA